MGGTWSHSQQEWSQRQRRCLRHPTGHLRGALAFALHQPVGVEARNQGGQLGVVQVLPLVGQLQEAVVGPDDVVALRAEEHHGQGGIDHGVFRGGVHGAGVAENIWTADHDEFLESMADAAQTIQNYFKENIVYINVMCNMSVDCDCCAEAEDPKIADIGILCSVDPVALDQACVDLVYASEDPGKVHLIERMESRHGILTVEAAEKLNIGSREYELVNLD